MHAKLVHIYLSFSKSDFQIGQYIGQKHSVNEDSINKAIFSSPTTQHTLFINVTEIKL